MYKLRLANEGDLEVLLDMGRRFYETSSPFADTFEFSPESCVLKVFNMMEDGLLMVAEEELEPERYADPADPESPILPAEMGPVVAMMGFQYGQFEFNVNHKVATEKMFWIEEEARGGMLARLFMVAAATAAKMDDCDAVVMSLLSTSPPHVDGLYRAMGYKPFETGYIKEI